MMKCYKPVYGASFLWGFIYKLPMLIVPGIAAIVLANCGQNQLWHAMPMLCGVFCALIFVGLVLIAVNTLVMRVFKKERVLLSREEVICQEQRFRFNNIKYITLYLSEQQRYGRGKPRRLCLWVSDNDYIVIKRPSVALIMQLKRSCKNAAFEIDEWKIKLKMYLLIDLVVGIVLTVGIFCGWK